MKRSYASRFEPEEASKRHRRSLKVSDSGDTEALDSQQLDQIVDFLHAQGGSFDYGRFAAEFPGVKKRMLEPHFDFVCLADGRWEIRLIESHGDAYSPIPRRHSESTRQDDRSRPGVGRILFYDRTKGYGYVSCAEESRDVHFPRHALPRDLQERHGEDLRSMEVSFDLYTDGDGNPHADRIYPASGSRETSRIGHIHTGTIVRYDKVKAYGFIAPDDHGEDIFFLRSEMPHELAGLNKWDQIVDARVQFEVLLMSDGKHRAKRIQLISMPSNRDSSRRDPSPSRGSRNIGRILKFDRVKGYGFVGIPGDEDVFFLPSALPKELSHSFSCPP